jgi:anti-sigma B factor antagonist
MHGCVIVGVRGEADLRSVPAIEQYLSAVIAMQEPAIVLDLSRMAFTDCASLRVLLDAGRRAAARGKSFVLATPRPAVSRLLEVTDLDRHITVFPTVGEAVVTAQKDLWPAKRRITWDRPGRVAPWVNHRRGSRGLVRPVPAACVPATRVPEISPYKIKNAAAAQHDHEDFIFNVSF